MRLGKFLPQALTYKHVNRIAQNKRNNIIIHKDFNQDRIFFGQFGFTVNLIGKK